MALAESRSHDFDLTKNLINRLQNIMAGKKMKEKLETFDKNFSLISFVTTQVLLLMFIIYFMRNRY